MTVVTASLGVKPSLLSLGVKPSLLFFKCKYIKKAAVIAYITAAFRYI